MKIKHGYLAVLASSCFWWTSSAHASCNYTDYEQVTVSGQVTTQLNGAGIPYASVTDDYGNSVNADGGGNYSFSVGATGYLNSYSTSTNCTYTVYLSDNVCATAPGYFQSCAQYSSGDNNFSLAPIYYSTNPVVKSVSAISSNTIGVVFSQPMDASSVNRSNFVLLDPSNSAQAITVTYSPFTNTASLVTASPLVNGGKYTLKVAKNGDGANLLFVVNGTGRTTGTFVTPTQISGFGIAGTFNSNGSISWSNGSVWTKLGAIPTQSPSNIYPSLAGNWIDAVTVPNQVQVTQYGTQNTAGMSLSGGAIPAFTVNYTAGSIYPDIAGSWIDKASNTVMITEANGTLSYLVNGTGLAAGVFKSATQISGFSLVGTLSSGNTVISWTNGSVWTKVVTVTYPNIAGNWIDKANNTVLVTEYGATLTFLVNGSGSANGVFKSATQISAWNLVGTLNSNSSSISWSNGSVWNKVGATPAPVPAPSTLSLSGATSSSVTANWTSAGGTTAGFIANIQAGNVSALTCVGGTDMGVTLTKTFASLSANTLYTIAVCAYDINHVNSSSLLQTATTLNNVVAIPPTSSALTFSGVTSSGYSVSWVSGGGSTAGFVVNTQAGSNAALACTGGINVGTALTKSFTGLSASTLYTVALCAVNSANVMSSPVRSNITTSAASTGYPNIAGNWIDKANNTVVITETGANLSFVVNGSGTTTGVFTSTTKISAFGLTGAVNADGSISWSNGSVWTKAAVISYPNIAGNWIDKANNTIKITESGASLVFLVNGSGTASGVFKSATQISAWSLVGTVNADGSISWTNGSIWTKVN